MQSTAGDPQDESARPRSLLARNRPFLLLWSGESISLLGSEISVVALPSLAVLVFGSGAVGVGMLVALQWLPFVLLAPVMGVVTDRLRRRPLMLVANMARFVILGSLPLAAVLDRLTVPHLYLAALLKGVFDVVFQVAYQAYMPQLLDRADLVDGNVKTQLSRSFALVAGRSIGGALVGLIGAARAVAADAASYVVAAATLLFIRQPESPPTPSQRGVSAALKDIRDSMPMALGNRVVRHLMLMATFGNMGGSLALAMVIVYAYEDLHLSSGQLGLALSLGGAAVLLGAAMSQRINERLGMGRSLVLTHAMLALAFLLLPTAVLGGTTFGFAIIVVSQAISNFTMPVTNVAVMTLIQKATPSDMLGRVTGVALPFVWGANALGPVVGTAVAAATGNTAAFLLSSLLAGTAVLWILVGGLHRLTDEVPEQLRVSA
ncbi:MFS transporter [Streptomyces djakartensis]|uniref:MFS transporter n=1 Tax=Streptomyces djakartensis TaxID=68193 RepID=A0ABQ2ZGL1_9ACTN|nr:MFS transporter [Streptomyces djakartensis]GGY15988.1 MFS transporter [Streptomyces djakartensis]